MPTVLTDADRDALFLAVRDEGPATDGTWIEALSALLPAYRLVLPDAGAHGTKIFQTITAISNSGRLIDGTVPMDVVLAKLAMLSPVASVSTLASALRAKVVGKVGGARLAAYDPGQSEAYTGAGDDMLSFDFLRDGDAVGRSVVKLIVPRFEAGQPAIGEMGKQRTYFGTGWLIAQELVVTNFHVICARENDEPDPDPTDVERQVAGTVCLFGLDRDGAVPVAVLVTGAAALGARGGARDYALLRVKPSADWPTPLRLRRQPPSVPKEGYPINIIQHPAGLPKRIAVRSNLLKSASPERLEYFSDTLAGSSGSPLCNDAWEVIGLHRASGPLTNVFIKGRPAAAHNVGIPIGAVLDDLRKIPEAKVYDEIAPSVLP